MRRASRRTVFVTFGNAHKIAESLFRHLKRIWSYGKNGERHHFLVSFELKTARFSQSSSVKNGTLRAFLRERRNPLFRVVIMPRPPKISRINSKISLVFAYFS